MLATGYDGRNAISRGQQKMHTSPRTATRSGAPQVESSDNLEPIASKNRNSANGAIYLTEGYSSGQVADCVPKINRSGLRTIESGSAAAEEHSSWPFPLHLSHLAYHLVLREPLRDGNEKWGSAANPELPF